ncbi:MAG: hypothetical protein H6Q90_291 [Deltaproteobacteria bacterium]|nr:hypothetical protein [Deltaproteobacteria bacterium]
MVGGSLLTGLALHSVTPMAPLVGGLVGIAAGAAWGYGHAKGRVIAAGLAVVPLFAMTMGWASALPSAVGFVVSASVLALGLSIGGPRGVRGAIGVGLSALTALVAMWCALRIVNARETATWSTWMTTACGAAAMGMVGVFAMLPRHLKLALDPVQAMIRRLPANLDPEVKNLCDRSITIWNGAKEQLADDGGKDLVRDGVMKTLEVAVKSSEVKVIGTTETELSKRMADLDHRIATTSDAEAKAQYQSARAALDDQRRYRDHIAKGRERLVARMHNHVAALEKFQLAATGLQAARAASTGATAIQQLDELSHDVAASGDALADLELAESPVPVATLAIGAETAPDADSNALA